MPVSTLGGPGKFAETPQCQVTSRSPSTCPRPARYAGEFPGWRSLLPMRPLPLPAIARHVGCLAVSRHRTLGGTFFYYWGRLVATRKEEERSPGRREPAMLRGVIGQYREQFRWGSPARLCLDHDEVR